MPKPKHPKQPNKTEALLKALIAVGYASADEVDEIDITEVGLPSKLDLSKLDAAALFYDGQWIVINLE